MIMCGSGRNPRSATERRLRIAYRGDHRTYHQESRGDVA